MNYDKARVVRTQGPSQAEWEQLRPVIEQLYRTENKTENEVRKILLDKHNFSVTIKMFKQHIRKWRLDKKFKRHEMVFSIRKVRQRKAAGKNTRIFIRGQELTEAKLHYYFKRRPLTTAEQHQTEDNATTPSDLDYSTPASDRQEVGSEVDKIEDDEVMDDDIVELVGNNVSRPPGELIVRSESLPTISTSHDTISIDVDMDTVNNIVGGIHPQTWSILYDLNPQEAFLRQLYEHVRLTSAGQISKFQRRTRFDTSSILRASGWFDTHLGDAVEAEKHGRDYQAQSIVKRCANIVAAEVEGYFPDMCVLEMIEVIHFLQLRKAQQLQHQFLYHLYDSVTSRLGQFHPLVELLCNASRGYSSNLSATLIPTMLDFLDDHSKQAASLNSLLPLFAFQELRLIDKIPRDILMLALPVTGERCNKCTATIEQSPFNTQAFRSWAARQFVNLLNDVWVEPHNDQSAEWHSMRRSRVWRYIFKYPHMAERREILQKMPFKQRFWAVAKICFELVSKNIERIFLECHNFFPAAEHVSNLIQQSSRKIGLEEDEIQPLCTDTQETSILDTQIHGPGKCDDDTCKQVRKAVIYWIGNDLCCKG